MQFLGRKSCVSGDSETAAISRLRSSLEMLYVGFRPEATGSLRTVSACVAGSG